MKQEAEGYISVKDIVEFIKDFISFLRKKLLYFFVALVLGCAFGIYYYKVQKPKYQAVCTFILEEKSGGGGLSGLASQFGINIGGLSNGGSIFAGDNILNILKSKKVIYEVLLSKVNEIGTDSSTLADLYLGFSGLKKSWQSEPHLQALNFNINEKQRTPLQDSVLNLIYESLLKDNIATDKISKQGSIIKVQVTAADVRFARLLTERLVNEASELYLNIRMGTALENIMQLQKRSDSLLHLLNNRTYRAAASQPLDVNPGIKTAIVPVEIANRDKTVMATLYAEVTKNLEASKLLFSQQSPVIQLLDKPDYLLDDNKKGLSFILIVAAMISSFLYLLLAFMLFIFRKINS
ncbi:MAG TPA: hypothetical protein VD794_08075 [Flavisolibacter sp.]|nr:hypothetical protein [Flavisolibacter sp.]